MGSQNNIGLTYTGFRAVHSFREKAPAICTLKHNTENFPAWSSLPSCVHFSSLDLLLRHGHRIQIRDTRGMFYDLTYKTSQWGNPEHVKLKTVVTFTILQLGSSVSLPTSCLNTSPGDSTLTDSLTLLSAAAKSLQLCPTLCNPRDGSPPGSPIPGILQAINWSGLPFPSPMHESEK